MTCAATDISVHHLQGKDGVCVALAMTDTELHNSWVRTSVHNDVAKALDSQHTMMNGTGCADT